MSYRLSLDLGSTSLGWCIYFLDKNGRPSSIKDMGVRIFSDGRDAKTLEPLAVARRNARGMRRNLDRRDARQKQLMRFLIENGLMPADEVGRKALESLNPYELRAKAVEEKLPPYHLGRALFHINQRRGFKSNRKTDKRENDLSNMKIALRDLQAELQGRTLGQYMWERHKANETVRVRSRMVKNKAEYNFYPGREMYRHEVDTILETQDVPAPVADGIRDIIFFQRPLKPPPVGKCRFDHAEPRARLALPVVQKFRILQEVNNLELIELSEGDPVLDQEDRQTIVSALLSSRKKTFGQIRTLLKLGRDCRFNLEKDNRDHLKGDETNYFLSQDSCFGTRWQKFSQDEQEAILALLLEEQDPDEVVHQLMTEWDVSEEQAEVISGAPLPDGYGSVSKKAIMKMMPFLEQGLKYSEAAEKAGYHHSDFRTGQVYDRLPYYGQVLPNSVIGGTSDEKDKDFPEKFYGKINNPTVHIVLNQVRKLVNAVIDAYGHPDEVVVELARDLKEPRDGIIKEQTKNTKDNERINKELEKLGVKANYRNRMLYKLWEDLASDPSKRCCPFSGIQIAAHEIFSGNFEEEHLLPFSRSYNDGRANKVLAHRDWNRRKANRDPFSAFGHETCWPEIAARIQNLPANKQWRFQADCWDIAKGKGEDIIARMLNDTRYMSRLTRQYLSAAFDNEKGKSKVWAVPGQMTALLRDKWGLNDLLGEEDGLKDRADHRHHAIDAAVIGCTDRGMLQYLASAASTVETKPELWEKRRKLVMEIQEPFPGFLKQVGSHLDKIVVSHKPDHGGAAKAIRAVRPYTIAPLHEQTAYGKIGPGQKKGTILVATRKPVDSFSKLKQIGEIADPAIRANLLKILQPLKEGSAEWKQALLKFTDDTRTRRVRIHIEKSHDVVVPIRQPKDRGPEETRGAPYKLYALGGNYCAEIYCADKGEQAGKWQCEIVSNYHAHQKDFVPVWKKENPTARLVMRLQIDDMVAYDENGTTVISRVKKMSGGRVYLRPHQIAEENADKLSWAASANQLQLKNSRKISVDILGRVKDPFATRKKGGIAA